MSLALWKLWTVAPEKISPEHWFSASNECVVITLIVSWLVTFVFNRELIWNNPLRTRLGYNNVCVAWDAPPTLFVAAPLFTTAIYCQMRYCWLDNMRCRLSDASDKVKTFVSVFNHFNAIAYCVFPLVFVITPDRNAIAHSSAFVCLIVGNLVGFLGNFIETQSKYYVKGSKIYICALVFFAIGFPICVVVNLAMYDEVTGTIGPIPVWFGMAMDYGWFFCIFLQSAFFPRAPSLKFQYELVEDADFTFDGREPVAVTTSGSSKGYRPSWFKVWKPVPGIVAPEAWFSASNEFVVYTAILSWIITFFFNRDLIFDNPLLRKLGYNNVCIAWDAPPSLYPAACCFTAAIASQIRYCRLDWLRGYLMAQKGQCSEKSRHITAVANYINAASYCVFPLVFVITPDRNAMAHSCAFVCLIVGNLVGFLVNFATTDKKYHVKGAYVYCVIHTFFAIIFPLVVVIQLHMFDEETETRGPIPVWIGMVADYGWFACMAMQGPFMPRAPSLKFSIEVVSDEDYTLTAGSGGQVVGFPAAP